MEHINPIMIDTRYPHNNIVNPNKETCIIMCIKINDEDAGRLIGKEASIISKIASNAGVTLSIDQINNKTSSCLLIRSHGIPDICLIKLQTVLQDLINIIPVRNYSTLKNTEDSNICYYKYSIDIHKEVGMVICIQIYEQVIGKIIGKNGTTVSTIARSIGVSINVEKQRCLVIIRAHGTPIICLEKLIDTYTRINNILKIDEQERRLFNQVTN